MNSVQTFKEGGDRLKNNTTPAIAITTAVMVIWVMLAAVCAAAYLFFETLFLRAPQRQLIAAVLAALITFAAYVCSAYPLRLSVKYWYYTLDTKSTLYRAFASFLSPEEYRRAVKYSFRKITADMALAAAVLLPLFSYYKLISSATQWRDGSLYITILIIYGILNLLDILLVLYIYCGFTFADYIFASHRENSFSAAVSASFKIAVGHRKSYVALFFINLPGYIAGVLIATMPFTMPQINSVKALFAKTNIERYYGGIEDNA